MQDTRILIFDEDPRSRQVVSAVLTDANFHVIEAASHGQAMSALDLSPQLMIVNCTASSETSIDLISRVQKVGHRMPIVVISNSWCDPQTYMFLSSVLKVSVILNEPIAAHVLLKQVSFLLLEQKTELSCTEMSAVPDSAADLPTSAKNSDCLGAAESKSALGMNAYGAVQLEYTENLPSLWAEIKRCIQSTKHNPAETIGTAGRLAHQLRGSAGCYGHSAISDAAGKIEDGLIALIGSSPSNEPESSWAAIRHGLVDGDAYLRNIGQRVHDNSTGDGTSPSYLNHNHR